MVVVLSWAVVCLFSAWPLMTLSGLNFTQAVFESVSGWTTTGLSVVDVTAASHAVLLWRSTMQVAGGAGLAIIMLSALIGSVGPAVSAAEGREQLVPHVRESARLVMMIYGGYTIAGIVGLHLVGMTLVRRGQPLVRGRVHRGLLHPRREHRATGIQPPWRP